jgi:hypothetical protein
MLIVTSRTTSPITANVTQPQARAGGGHEQDEQGAAAGQEVPDEQDAIDCKAGFGRSPLFEGHHCRASGPGQHTPIAQPEDASGTCRQGHNRR